MFGLDREPIAPAVGRDHVRAQLLTQTRDVHVHGLGGSRGGSLAPQLVNQAVDRDHFTAVKHEHSQQRSLLRRTEDDRLAVPHDLQRPKYPELH